MPDYQESPSKELDAHKGDDLSAKADIIIKDYWFGKDRYKGISFESNEAIEKVIQREMEAVRLIDNLSKQLTQTQQALDVAVEALEWYVDQQNYLPKPMFDCHDTEYYPAQIPWERGNRAKAALNTIRKK